MFSGVIFVLLLAIFALLAIGFIRAMSGKSSPSWEEELSPEGRGFLKSTKDLGETEEESRAIDTIVLLSELEADSIH